MNCVPTFVPYTSATRLISLTVTWKSPSLHKEGCGGEKKRIQLLPHVVVVIDITATVIDITVVVIDLTVVQYYAH